MSVEKMDFAPKVEKPDYLHLSEAHEDAQRDIQHQTPEEFNARQERAERFDITPLEKAVGEFAVGTVINLAQLGIDVETPAA